MSNNNSQQLLILKNLFQIKLNMMSTYLTSDLFINSHYNIIMYT